MDNTRVPSPSRPNTVVVTVTESTRTLIKIEQRPIQRIVVEDTILKYVSESGGKGSPGGLPRIMDIEGIDTVES